VIFLDNLYSSPINKADSTPVSFGICVSEVSEGLVIKILPGSIVVRLLSKPALI